MDFATFLVELKKLAIELTLKQQQQIETYIQELIKYNSHTNLTSIKDYNSILLKHFFDSLTLVKAYDFNREINLLDIGSGAGFPGLVLKIVFPKINLTLLDSNNKKTKFLDMIVAKLELTNVTVVNERAEIFIKNHREFYDVVTARAVAHLRIIAELGIPFLKVEGKLLAMKANINQEITESKTTLEYLVSEIMNVVNFNLPIDRSIRNIIIIEKKSKTPTNIPRNFNQILKKTLQK